MNELELETAEARDCERLGESLGSIVASLVSTADRSGLVVGLIGSLGAGKTTFVRGVARGLGVDDDQIVASPTFVLIHEYDGPVPLFHFDVYRLPSAEALLSLGFDDYCSRPGLCLIEWADKFAEVLPDDRLTISISHLGGDRRKLAVKSSGPRSQRLLSIWSTAIAEQGDSTTIS